MKNDITAKRLSDALSQNNMKAQELSVKSGVSKNSISQYINGTHAPSNVSAGKMAKVLGVSPVWLMGFDVPMIETVFSKYPNVAPVTTRRFPVLGSIACGEPKLMTDGIETYVDANISADFVLYAKGDSMIDARIYDGDLVFVRQQPTVENGQIAAVAIDDEATLKRFYKYDDLIVLRACNPAYPDIEIRPGDMRNVSVLGLAVAFQSLVK